MSASSRMNRLMLVATVTSAALMSAPGARAQNDQSLMLDEIIVTAQRRSESLQQTPIAISAISGEMLQARQLEDTKAVIFNAPNLTGNSNIGQSTATTFFIRGVGTTENLATADTSVGLYIDDVYVARQAVNNFQLFDVERIEVLRGPQGTLYGRNTNGGAIKIVTRKPDDVAALSAQLSYGNYDRYEAKLSGNVPLSDSVFVSAGFLAQEADGWKRNTTLGRDVDTLNYVGGRLAVRALVGEGVTADLLFDIGRDRTDGGYASDIAGVLRPSTGDLRTVVSGTDANGYAKTWGLSANIAWAINDQFSLTSITGYRKTIQELVLDLSDQPVALFELVQDQDADQFSQELQLNGALTDSLSLTAGLYYFNEDVAADLSNKIGANVFANAMTVEVESYAAFAHLDYAVGPLTFVAGGRFTHDSKQLTVSATSTIPAPNFNFDTDDLIALGAAGQPIDPEQSFDRFTPKLGVNWQLNDDHFAYISWTKGFRSGGWTGRAVNRTQFVNFEPENVQSWEAGLRSSLLNGRMTWNNTGFFMKYTDLFNTLTINGIFTVQTANAEIYGLESEMTLRAASWLDLFANVGLLETQYTGAQAANLADELQRAPAFQGKAGFSVDYPLSNGAFVMSADLFYTTDYLVNPANLAVTAPLVDPEISRTDDYAIVNAQIGYRFGPDENYRVGLSCSNCLDKDYFDAITVIGGYAAAYAGAPRRYRITLDARF